MSGSLMLKSSTVMPSTSRVRSSGQGSPANARSICALMNDPPCLASSSFRREPWWTPVIN